jgi:hypothetical protein
VISSHGGRVGVASTPGGGATFRVELPLTAAGLPEEPEDVDDLDELDGFDEVVELDPPSGKSNSALGAKPNG